MKNTNKALATVSPSALAKTSNGTVQKMGPAGMMLGNLGIKQVMIADIGDGAFTDQSIKVKPNKTGPGFVLKCTDRARLLAGLAQAGVDPRLVEIKRGSKHWVAFVNKAPSTGAIVKM